MSFLDKYLKYKNKHDNLISTLLKSFQKGGTIPMIGELVLPLKNKKSIKLNERFISKSSDDVYKINDDFLYELDETLSLNDYDLNKLCYLANKNIIINDIISFPVYSIYLDSYYCILENMYLYWKMNKKHMLFD